MQFIIKKIGKNIKKIMSIINFLKEKLKKKYYRKFNSDLAFFLCEGEGLEIGALSSPYKFNKNCKLKYADIYDKKKLESIVSNIPIDNLYAEKYVDVDYILSPPKYLFESIGDNSFDFVYSSHSLEHSPNPVSSLVDQIRITKPGGIIYSVLPNKNYTYDKKRNLTSSKFLIQKHESKIYDHTIEEALDVVINTFDHPLYEKNKYRAEEYAKEMILNKEGIHHFYTFDDLNVMEIFIYLLKKNIIKIEHFSAKPEKDIHFALRVI